MQGEYVFGRGSNVLEYWLLHAEGFVVRRGGARVGVVRDVVLDGARGRASSLVVRSPFLQRRRVVPARLVDAVDPEARELELEPRPRRVRVAEPVERGPSTIDTLAVWADELDRHVDVAAAWLSPRLRAWSLAATAYVRRYVST